MQIEKVIDYSPTWLNNQTDNTNIRILDARSYEVYTQGHIPNAVHIDINALRYAVDGVEGVIIPPELFATVIGNLGIDNGTQVIIYDDYFGMVAARIAWSLVRYGHKKVGILDGGWDGWVNNGYPISSNTPQVMPTQFTVQSADEVDASIDWIKANLGSSDVVFLDVRSKIEHQNGTIPGSIFWEWQRGTTFDTTFGDLETIRSDLVQHGVTPDKEIVAYCQAGVRAAHTFFLLQALGYERVRMYDGSWAEWSIKAHINHR